MRCPAFGCFRHIVALHFGLRLQAGEDPDDPISFDGDLAGSYVVSRIVEDLKTKASSQG